MELPILFVALAVAFVLLLVLIVFLVKQNKAGMQSNYNVGSSNAMGKGMAIGIAIGMGTGVALGAALDSMGTGIAIGAGVGVSMGVAFGSTFEKKELEGKNLNPELRSYPYKQNRKSAIYIGLAAFFAGLLILGLIFFLNLK